MDRGTPFPDDPAQPVDSSLQVALVPELEWAIVLKRFRHPIHVFLRKTDVYFEIGIVAGESERPSNKSTGLFRRIPQPVAEPHPLAFLLRVVLNAAEIDQAQPAVLHENVIAGMRIAIAHVCVIEPDPRAINLRPEIVSEILPRIRCEKSFEMLA